MPTVIPLYSGVLWTTEHYVIISIHDVIVSIHDVIVDTSFCPIDNHLFVAVAILSGNRWQHINDVLCEECDHKKAESVAAQ